MIGNSGKLIKSWYWQVEPAKFFYAQYKKFNGPLYCFRKCTPNPVTYTKDSNGIMYNQHATFKCSYCKKKIKCRLFYSHVLKGDPNNLPTSTNYFDYIDSLEKNVTNNIISNESDRASYPDNLSFADQENQSFIEGPDAESPTTVASTSTSMASKMGHFISPSSEAIDNICFGSDRTAIPIEQLSGSSSTINSASHKRRAPEPEILPYNIEAIMIKRLDKHISDYKKSTSDQLNSSKKENVELKSLIFGITGEIDRLKKNISLLVSNQNISAPQKNPEPSTENLLDDNEPSSSRSPKRARYSYSEIIQKMNKSGSVAEFNSKLNSLKKITGVKFSAGTLDCEIKHNFSRVFVQGIVRQGIYELKNDLKNLGFKPSKIINIRFIGRFTAEFTLIGGYSKEFIELCNIYQKFIVLPKMNPSKPIDPNASAEVQSRAKSAYIKSLSESLEKSRNLVYRDYLKDLANELELNLDIQSNDNTINPEPIISSILEPRTMVEVAPNTPLHLNYSNRSVLSDSQSYYSPSVSNRDSECDLNISSPISDTGFDINDQEDFITQQTQIYNSTNYTSPESPINIQRQESSGESSVQEFADSFVLDTQEYVSESVNSCCTQSYESDSSTQTFTNSNSDFVTNRVRTMNRSLTLDNFSDETTTSTSRNNIYFTLSSD
ncbi:hypothetical protein AYI70_g2014 [Smittium culicis]|uniref:Uncharacterized protein n=1 Tax=Smittium culicis TaxID=133412 RepID=A0A1R1YAA9_9FUNG|nr:hypothetical protein AYI70_g2014 [Smittium culicis]